VVELAVMAVVVGGPAADVLVELVWVDVEVEVVLLLVALLAEDVVLVALRVGDVVAAVVVDLAINVLAVEHAVEVMVELVCVDVVLVKVGVVHMLVTRLVGKVVDALVVELAINVLVELVFVLVLVAVLVEDVVDVLVEFAVDVLVKLVWVDVSVEVWPPCRVFLCVRGALRPGRSYSLHEHRLPTLVKVSVLNFKKFTKL
jgi:hypothetical protein